MQLIKKIFNSFLILAGIVIMVVLFGFALMMLFHISIFGYTYASAAGAYGENFEFIAASINSIDIETQGVSLEIHYSSDVNYNKVSVIMYEDFQGIVKDDVKSISFAENPNVQSGVLKVATTEPSGLIVKNNSKISISLPRNKVLSDLNIKCGGKEIDFGTDENQLVVNNLNLISTRRSINPGITLSENLKVQNDLYLETFAGRIKVNAYIGNDVNIKTNIGTIIFNRSLPANVTITGEDPNVEFGEVRSSLVSAIENEKEYDLSALKQVNIGGSLNILDVERGNIKISGTVGEYVYMKAPNVQLWANKISKGITCSNGSNDIKIFGSLGAGNQSGESILNVGSHLFINEAYGTLKVNADKNGVNIRNAHGDVNVQNNNKETIVSFANDAVGKTLTVEQKSGNIVARNILGTAILNAPEGKIEAIFANITGENKINCRDDAAVKTKDGLVYELTTKTKSGSVDVRLGSVAYDNWNDATKDGDWKVVINNINSADSSTLTDKLVIAVSGRGKTTVSAY